MEWYLSLTLLLVAAGAVLLAGEFFLPTGGFLVVIGVLCFAVAVGVVLLYGDMYEAIGVILAVCVGVPVAGWQLVANYEERVAAPLLGSESVATTMATLPGIAELDKLRGRFGRTVTPMRPAGAVEIDGRRVDAQSEGPLIAPGVWVKCVDVRAGKVVVREADAPSDLLDLPLDGLG